MKEIVCTTQAELDAVPVDFDGRVVVKFGTPYNRAVINRRFKYAVMALENSSVVAWGNSSVVALENSSVVARENSSVEAWGNSSVEALENSSVMALENSSVVAWGNSSVVARGNSSVVALENSSVEALENSSVEAWGNAQIVDVARKGNVRISGNARVVHNPLDIDEYIDFYGLESTESTVRLFKAVHFTGEKYYSDADYGFIYTIGGVAVPTSGFDDNVHKTCGAGINLAHKAWALNYGYTWDNLAILELECEKADVLVPLMSNGKVRARKAKVIREVPLEECGLLGKMLAKQRAKQ